MKKAFLIVCMLVLTCDAHAFWIWSPKTQEWKNPENSPLATPTLQLQKALKLFHEGANKAALKEFHKLLVHYPDSQQAAEAQYYTGRVWEELKNPYQAYLEYQKVIDVYPNSKRIQEIVERNYHIGEYFFNREPSSWLGISLYELVEHPSLEIFRKIIEDTPYSEYAPAAQYKLGVLLAKLERYNEAKETFQQLLDNYPESEWAEAAKYQLALTSVQSSSGVQYDDTFRQEAIEQFEDFLKAHPDTQLAEGAQKQFRVLRNEEAKKQFETAEFYERQRKVQSALLYYNLVIENFPDTDYAEQAKKKVEDLTP